MAIKCPKCHSENPDTLKFCGECGTPLTPSLRDIKPEVTETLQAPVKELTTGSTFAGRYQIIEELGHGGMGRVYKVQDTKIGEKVALKLLRPEAGLDKKSLERFSNEIKLARKIRHKNVCQMFDLGEDEGTRFITMEYVHGEDLKQLIRKVGRLSPGQAVGIARQVCDGLGEAHKLGVVHRDLKPQNIMVDEDGTARIMDFGIARSLSGKSMTGAGVIIGTPEYMSPEQVEGKDIDQRSDIYSLGIILYEMLTGQVPFEGDTPFTIGMKHKSERPKDPRELNDQISDDLSGVILKCLEKARENRYQSAAELDSDLAKIGQGIPGREQKIPFKKAPTSKTITVHFSLRKPIVLTLIFVSIVIIGVVAWRLLLGKRTSKPLGPPSVAVLPFEDMSPQKDQEYFCDGLTDELINRLSNIRELRVPARTSAFYFKGKTQDIQEVGQKLKVEKVLEGSVRKAGDTLRITAQLINIADGYPLWSKTYDRELKDVFSIQDEISLQIINKLKIELLGDEKARVIKRYTDNTEAYDSYMRGMWLLDNKLTEEEWRKAILYFERAIEMDPNFSLAHVGLARAHLSLLSWHFISADEGIPKAKKALDQALRIDHDLPEALAWSSFIKYNFEYDWPGGESDIKKALELNPNCGIAHGKRSEILLSKGNINEAVEEASAFVESDPLSLQAQAGLARTLYLVGRCEEAIKQCKKTLEVDPEYPYALASLGKCYVQKGLLQEAIASLQKAVAFSGHNTECLSYLAYAYVVSGNLKKTHEILRELDKRSETAYVSKYYLASIYAAMGDKDKAFELLEASYKERDANLPDLPVDPEFVVLRSDPRYEMMLKKIGLET